MPGIGEIDPRGPRDLSRQFINIVGHIEHAIMQPDLDQGRNVQ